MIYSFYNHNVIWTVSSVGMYKKMWKINLMKPMTSLHTTCYFINICILVHVLWTYFAIIERMEQMLLLNALPLERCSELNVCLVYMETSIQTGVSSSLTAPRCLQHVNLSFLCQRDLCLPLTAEVSAVYLSWAHLWSAFTFKCSGLVLATYCALNVWDALKTVHFTGLSHISARIICIYSPPLLQRLLLCLELTLV